MKAHADVPMTARVGEIVHYFCDEDGEHPLAAMVVFCHTPYCVNLSVYPDNSRRGGLNTLQSSCTPWYGKGERKGHWLCQKDGVTAQPEDAPKEKK